MAFAQPVDLRTLVGAGAGQIKADRIIRNGQLVNVASAEVYPADIAMVKSRIVAIGDVNHCLGENTEIIDARGAYLCPGLIDGHLHVECSKLSLTSFAKLVVPLGTTSIVSGLDQILAIHVHVRVVDHRDSRLCDHRHRRGRLHVGRHLLPGAGRR